MAIQPSSALAEHLRRRRLDLRLSLRSVQEKTAALGCPIPFTTLTKIERGLVDPGIKRLHILAKLYELPLDLLEDVLDIEEFAGEAPEPDMPFEVLHKKGLEHWKAGRLREALGYMVRLRVQVPDDPEARVNRQRSVLSLAVALGSLGKYRLSQQIVNDLLVEPPVDEVLVQVLIQAAVCWHWLGSGEAALAFLARAESLVGSDDSQRRAWILHERASTFISLGQYDPAEAELRKTIRAYRDAGDDYGEGRALASRVRLLLEKEEFESAARLSVRAARFADKHAFARLGTTMRIAHGQALMALGREARGLALLRESLAHAVQSSDPVNQFFAHHALWKTYKDGEDPELAEVELRAARYFLRFVDARIPEAAEIREG